MAVKISNSGHDEHGRYTGGKAGDQTGTEWYIRDWYKYPYGGWDCIIRHPDKKVREKFAELSEKAAKNDKVGYDQWQRETYWNQLKKVGYDPSKIKVACEDDCSAGVCANMKATGYLLNNSKLKNISITSTHYMKNMFKNAGCKILTNSKYLTSDKYLLRGDILLSEANHTCAVISNGSKANVTDSVSKSTTALKDATTIAKEVINGDWGNGDERKERLTAAGYNYTVIQNKVTELLKQEPAKVTYTKYVVLPSAGLNCRKGPGTSYAITRVLTKGTVIQVSSISAGWAKTKQGDYCSAQYLSKK